MAARPRLAALVVLLLAGGTSAGAHDAHEAGTAVAPAPSVAQPGADTPIPFGRAGPFSLVDHTGMARSETDFAGRHRLVYFGYTACPNTCGLALANISGTLDRLASEAARIAALFVSIDPEYDTPGRMATYLANFHPDIVGLTGERDDIRRVAGGLNVVATPVEDPGRFERLVDHTPFIYLIAPDGAVLSLIPPIMPADAMADLIRRYIE